MELKIIKSGLWGSCLWGIDDTGFLVVDEGTATSINVDSDVPWDDCRNKITEVQLRKNVMMPEGASLSGLFKNCPILEKVNLSGLDTSTVADMSSMFENCSSLKDMSLVSFNTEKAKNMNRMFYGCRSLAILDLSSFNTTEVDDMNNMFGKCRKLHTLTLGDRFCTVGSGKTNCGNLIIKDTGRYRMAKVVSVIGRSVYYQENRASNGIIEKQLINGLTYEVEPITFDRPGEKYQFFGWNTKPDGSGMYYNPGDKIDNMGDDIDLYAIWASPPTVGELAPPREIEYGSPLVFDMPKAFSEPPGRLIGCIEINPNGDERLWQKIGKDEILPVSYNGYMMRLAVSNDYGTTYSNPVRIKIRKATIDISSAHWVSGDSMIYDGTEKTVWLEGLPKEVTVVYENNVATNAGIKTAVAHIGYDETNYERPIDIAPCVWEIKKAFVDASSFEWTSCDDFVYDGTPKRVGITNLPEGAEIELYGAEEVLAGKYLARAKLSGNYYTNDTIEYEWEIKKAKYNMIGVHWSYSEPVTYDNSLHEITLVNVPSGLSVKYYGNVGMNAGDYKATAGFVCADPQNYEPPQDMSINWTIKKAVADMSNVRWNYVQPFVYDGEVKSVDLAGLPSGILAVIDNGSAINVGTYLAVANFEIMGSSNYNEPDPVYLKWEIKKSAYDMTNVRWQDETTFAYDESEKAIYLEGLPEGVTPIYEGNAATVAGEYLASVDFEYDEHNYEKPVFEKCRWTIEKSALRIGKAKWDYTDPLVYDGTEKTVKLVDLPEGTEVDYSNAVAINVGTYYASADLFPVNNINYTVAHAPGLTWKIEKGNYDMSEVHWDYDESFTYDGTEKRIELIGLPEGVFPVYMGNTGLQAGDYSASVSFKVADPENYNVPTFPGCQWVIQKADFDISAVCWEKNKTRIYNGRVHSVYIENVPDGVSVKYINNEATEAGRHTATAELTIEDAKNYNTPVVVRYDWEIMKADLDMSQIYWNYVPGTFVYDGSNKIVALENLPDCVKVRYTGNTESDAGEHLATAEFEVIDSNYKAPESVTLDWIIDRAECDMSNVKWNYSDAFVYDGKTHEIEVYDLPEYLKVSYKDNKKIETGEYCAIASFTSDSRNYRKPDDMTCSWAINKANCDISSIRWSYYQPFVYDASDKTIVLEGVPKELIVSYDGNTANKVGNYLARAEFIAVDEDNYNVPEAVECEWSIVKGYYDMSHTKWSKRSVIYSGTPQAIRIEGYPDEIRPVYTGDIGLDVGEYVASARFEYDTQNYNEPTIEDCKWTIVKGSYDMSNAYWDYNQALIYDGSVKSVELCGLPEGVTPVYSGNTAIESGDYIAEAVFEYDEKNYEMPYFEPLKWTVEKAEIPIDLTKLGWDYDETFVYDGSVHEVKLNTIVEKPGFFGRLRGKETHCSIAGVPEGFEAVYEENEKTEAGVYYARAYIRPTVNFNYKTFEVAPFRWSIRRYKINTENVRWNYDMSSKLVYNGQPKSVKLLGVPEGIEVFYINNSKVNEGTYIAKARLLYDTKNFEVDPVRDCVWRIEREQ